MNAAKKTIKKNRKKSDSKEMDLSHLDYQDSLLCDASDFFQGVMQEVFDTKKDFFVHAIVKMIREQEGYALFDSKSESGDKQEWIEIESLSRLRSVVGGRFQTLKRRWVEAGLPLREHRGDKRQDYNMVEEGWIELSNWVLQQGFEARLSPNKTTCLFELRKSSKSQ